MRTEPPLPPPATREIAVAALLATYGALSVFIPLGIIAFIATGSFSSGHGSRPPSLERLWEVVGGFAGTITLVGVLALVASIGLYRRRRWGRVTGIVVAGLLIVATPVWMVSDILVPGLSSDEAPDRVLQGLLHQLFGIYGRAIPSPPVNTFVGLVAAWGLMTHPRVAPPERPSGTGFGTWPTSNQGRASLALGAGSAMVTVVVIAMILLRIDSPLVAPIAVAIAVTAALAVGAAIVRRPIERQALSAGRPRSLGVLMGLLVIFALDAFLPYLAWLIGPLRPPTEVDESGNVIAGEPAAWDWTAGLLIAIAALVACTVALLAARSIRSRRARGPYLVPAATAISATWAAVWVFMAGAAVATLDGPAIFLSIALYGLALVALFAFPFAMWAVLAHRTWFDRGPGWTKAAAGVPTGRRAGPSPVVSIAVLALFSPIAVMAIATAIDPPPEPLGYSGVMFEDRAYRPAAPLVDVGDAVVSVGTLGAWTESLREVVSDPTVYAFSDTPAEQAIAIRMSASADYGEWPFLLLVRTDERVPNQLCRHIPIEDPVVSAAPCGLPEEILLDGRSYVRVQGFEVGPDDLARLDVKATTPEPADVRVDLTAYAIRDVQTEVAIALRLATRVVVYRTDPKVQPALALCRYSPGAMKNPLGDTAEVPFGCGVPSGILVDGVRYDREHQTDELLSVPASALTAQGNAVALFVEDRQGPFPPTLDATAYAIEGVAPADAIALKVGERVIVMRPYDTGGGLPVPVSLCRYVLAEVAARMEAEGVGPVGCP